MEHKWKRKRQEKTSTKKSKEDSNVNEKLAD